MISRRSFALGVAACFLMPSPSWALDPVPQDPRLNHHPDLPSALAHMRAQRWSDLTALVSQLPPDSAVVLLDDLGDQSDIDVDLAGLNGSSAGLTIQGTLLVNWGWRYRGSGAAGSVTDEMGAAYEERLRRALESLRAAIAADANDGVAHSFLFRTLKGLSAIDQLEPAWRAFENVTRKPVRAYSQFADALSAKWFGSDELMLGFARANQRSLEPASHALICQVANEVLLRHWRRDGVGAAIDFASRQAVLGEVGAASDAFRALPAPTDFWQTNYANAHFSFFFGFLGLNDHARPYLRSMGDSIAGPWALFGDEAFRMLERARTAAGIEST